MSKERFVQTVTCPVCGNDLMISVRTATYRPLRVCPFCRSNLTAKVAGKEVRLREREAGDADLRSEKRGSKGRRPAAH